VDSVIARLKTMPASADLYERLRNIDVDGRSDLDVAAWLIYLNRLSFNGVYRVNKNNQYNVPFGGDRSSAAFNFPVLRECSAALQIAQLHAEDFEGVLGRAKENDFVYFDPPYLQPPGLTVRVPAHAYNPQPFTLLDHRRLCLVARELKKSGVHLLISCPASPEIAEMYGNGFARKVVRAKRLVSGDLRGRKVVEEFLIY
jgi:DNA adenine methylase